MTKAIWAILLVAPMMFMALSGCTSCTEGPPVTARGITNADATAGVLGYALDIQVTDGPGGAPLAGAGVVVYYGGTTTGEWTGPRVEVRPDLVLVEPMNESGTVESKTTLRMMTDETGHVRARVPGNRIIGVVAAMDGFTEEWIPALASGDSGAEGGFTMPLYRANLSVDVDAVWAPGAASTGAVTNSQYSWDPHAAPFGESGEAARGYAARVVQLDLTVTWRNGANGAGDLGIGVGPPDDGPRYFSDKGRNVATGEQSESTVLDVSTLREHGILGASSIQAGAATETGFVAPFGLPYTLHIDALFDTARAAFAACGYANEQNDNDGFGAKAPNGGLLAAVLGLTAAAFITGRRRV